MCEDRPKVQVLLAQLLTTVNSHQHWPGEIECEGTATNATDTLTVALDQGDQIKLKLTNFLSNDFVIFLVY